VLARPPRCTRCVGAGCAYSGSTPTIPTRLWPSARTLPSLLTTPTSTTGFAKLPSAVCASATEARYVDRDWLSSLSYAYSIACADSSALLRQRCSWIASRLHDGDLLLPSIYVMFDIDPRTSLRRRSGRLRPGHPWNRPDALQRLREFYASPSDVLFPIHPGLAMALRLPARLTVSGREDRGKISDCLSALSGHT
jgi:hypothetical protein